MNQTGIAQRMGKIVPFYVMDLLARAKELEAQGRSIIHMEVGEPDFVTPQMVIDAGKAALDAGYTGYTAATGIPELRRAIAENYHRQYGIDLDPRRVIVTPGSSGALQLIMSVIVDPGQTVLMTDPGYPCNKNFVELVSGVPVTLPVGPETDYQLTARLVEDGWTDATRAVIAATPSNPTGTLISEKELTHIHQIVSTRGGSLVVDEIYQGLVYDTENYTALSFSDEVFVINSFSKYFGMTGWRLGWMVVPQGYIDAVDRVAQNLFLAAATLSQYAALAAFTPESEEILNRRVQTYKERRDYLLPILQEMGFKISVIPEGAFYIYADCSTVTDDSFNWVHELLEKEGVAITPGVDFGEFNANTHVRFAYTRPLAELERACCRLARFIK